MRLRVVPAGTGVQWVRAGIRTFFKQPLAMSGLFFLFMAALSVIGLLPAVGSVLSLVLVPAATLGLMVAAHEADQARFPMPTVLATGLTSSPTETRAMLSLGLVYAVAIVLLMGLSSLMDGGQQVSIRLPNGEPNLELLQQPSFLLSALLTLALYLPVAMAFWHAPALVHWHQVSVAKSLFFSLVACARNFWAMTVFSLTWAAVFISVMGVLSLVGALLGSAQLAAMMSFPAALLLMSMYFASLYFSFRDSFYDNAPTEPQP